MYKINLTLWERVQLDMCIPRNAPLKEIPQLLRVMDAISPTDAEKSAIDYDYRTIQTPRGPIQLSTWNEEKLEETSTIKGVKIETEDFKTLMKHVKDAQWPTHIWTVELHNKLDAAKED